MTHQEILNRVDHTLLTPTATWDQVRDICDEGLAFSTASVCIPPRYVKRAAEHVGSGLKICTVIGFPNGYSTPEVKVFETEDAVRNGADLRLDTAVTGFYDSLDDTFSNFTLAAENGLAQLQHHDDGGASAKGD